MYLRVVYSRVDPSKLDALIGQFEDKVAPVARTLPGYVVTSLIVSRETGDMISATGWDTLQAMNADEQRAQEARRQAQEAHGAGVLDIDRFESFLRHGTGKPLVLPGFVLWNELFAEVDKIDATIAFVDTRLKDNVSAQPGFRALNCGINRMTGRMGVSITWESAEARAANRPSVDSDWQHAAQLAGAKQARGTEFEEVFFHGRRASGEFFEARQPAAR
jgi:hypothetical protein